MSAFTGSKPYSDFAGFDILQAIEFSGERPAERTLEMRQKEGFFKDQERAGECALQGG